MTVADHFLDGLMLAEVTALVNTILTAMPPGPMLPCRCGEGSSMHLIARRFKRKFGSMQQQAQQAGRSG
jgi:hypothetical protein